MEGSEYEAELSLSSMIMQEEKKKNLFESRYVDVKVLDPKWTGGQLAGHRIYKVQTLLSESRTSIEVYRRFRDIQWLSAMLQEQFPGCIIPLIPHKSILERINTDDSEGVELRRRGMNSFLSKVINHRLLKDSDHLFAFLCDSDAAFQERREEFEKTIEVPQKRGYKNNTNNCCFGFSSPRKAVA